MFVFWLGKKLDKEFAIFIFCGFVFAFGLFKIPERFACCCGCCCCVNSSFLLSESKLAKKFDFEISYLF